LIDLTIITVKLRPTNRVNNISFKYSKKTGFPKLQPDISVVPDSSAGEILAHRTTIIAMKPSDICW
jgi:hypothetical protein